MTLPTDLTFNEVITPLSGERTTMENNICNEEQGRERRRYEIEQMMGNVSFRTPNRPISSPPCGENPRRDSLEDQQPNDFNIEDTQLQGDKSRHVTTRRIMHDPWNTAHKNEHSNQQNNFGNFNESKLVVSKII